MPDRAALVTGASSGIGLAIAHVLGEEGHGLTVAARRPEKLAGAVEELRAKGFEVEEVAANLTSEEEIQRVVAADMITPADIGEAVRYLLKTSPACIVPEIVFQRPGEAI